MQRDKVTLLFNANKEYDRQILKGIGHYLHSTRPNWELFLEEDFRCRLDSIAKWRGEGVIADFDDSLIREALADSDSPIVAIGGSYRDGKAYPEVPYVATDNTALVESAFFHLKQLGLERFAFFGMPKTGAPNWAIEREDAFRQVLDTQGYTYDVFRGSSTDVENWQKLLNDLVDWLSRLAKPVGIIAVTDVRARYLIQACQKAELLVPDDISIIGIDDDELARSLSTISISSVKQGCFNMGYQAAKLLDQVLNGRKLSGAPILVAPEGVIARQSTAFRDLADPVAKQAMHYIRLHAIRGIKVAQVANYLGISRTKLEQRFISAMGHSVHQELHNQKLMQACEMLKTTSENIEEVARSCGYSSKQYLSAVFQRHFNLTPLKFRELNKV